MKFEIDNREKNLVINLNAVEATMLGLCVRHVIKTYVDKSYEDIVCALTTPEELGRIEEKASGAHTVKFFGKVLTETAHDFMIVMQALKEIESKEH